MIMLKQIPTDVHLSRIYYELAKAGASCAGEKKAWPYEPKNIEELIALACDMSRFDPRLVDILVDFLSRHWGDVDPAKLRRSYKDMQMPQTVAVIGEFLLQAVKDEDAHFFVSYLSMGLDPAPVQFYFRNLYSIGGRLAQRAAEEGIHEYKKWGFLACERPMSIGTFDRNSRRNVLHRLLKERGEISLKDYLAAVQFSISRQQALLDIRSSGAASVSGAGRGAKWRLAA